MKFKDWHTRITAEAAEAEPQHQRLSFARRPMSPELRALFAAVERQKRRAA